MSTYKSVKKQIAELEKKAEILRKAEAAKVIAGIKIQIATYDLKPTDLFDDVMPAPAIASTMRKVPVVAKPSAAAKYMDPVSRKTWNGHGKPPAWIKTGNREDFLIAKVLANPLPAAKKAVSKPVAKTEIAKPVIKPAAPAAKKPAAAKKSAPAAKKPIAKAKTIPSKKPAAAKAKSAPAAVTAKTPAPSLAPVIDVAGAPATGGEASQA